MTMRRLTKEQKAAMHEADGGADIYSRHIAQRLREVQRDFPGFIVITPAAMPQAGLCRPYFGAYLTQAGAEAITPKKLLRRARQHQSHAAILGHLEVRL